MLALAASSGPMREVPQVLDCLAAVKVSVDQVPDLFVGQFLCRAPSSRGPRCWPRRRPGRAQSRRDQLCARIEAVSDRS